MCQPVLRHKHPLLLRRPVRRMRPQLTQLRIQRMCIHALLEHITVMQSTVHASILASAAAKAIQPFPTAKAKLTTAFAIQDTSFVIRLRAPRITPAKRRWLRQRSQLRFWTNTHVRVQQASQRRWHLHSTARVLHTPASRLLHLLLHLLPHLHPHLHLLQHLHRAQLHAQTTITREIQSIA